MKAVLSRVFAIFQQKLQFLSLFLTYLFFLFEFYWQIILFWSIWLDNLWRQLTGYEDSSITNFSNFLMNFVISFLF